MKTIFLILMIFTVPAHAVGNTPPPPASEVGKTQEDMATEMAKIEEGKNKDRAAYMMGQALSGCNDASWGNRKFCRDAVRGVIAMAAMQGAESRDRAVIVNQAMGSGKSRVGKYLAQFGLALVKGGVTAYGFDRAASVLETGFNRAGPQIDIGGDGLVGDSNSDILTTKFPPDPIIGGPDDTLLFPTQ